MKTTWLHSMVQGDATQYYRKRNGIMVEHMVRPANFDMRYNHFHQEYEIYHLLRGRRQMFFENRAYEAQAGNLILVDSGQIHMSHSIVGDPETEYERVILYVDRDIVEKVDKMFPELKIGAFFHKHYGIYELTPKPPIVSANHGGTGQGRAYEPDRYSFGVDSRLHLLPAQQSAGRLPERCAGG